MTNEKIIRSLAFVLTMLCIQSMWLQRGLAYPSRTVLQESYRAAIQDAALVGAFDERENKVR